MPYITIRDIVERLVWRKPYWNHGRPTISVEGNKGEFGKLVFDFHDEVISINVYLHVSPSEIERLAHLAITVFPDMGLRIVDWHEETYWAYNTMRTLLQKKRS
jgi:hypothetical protein